MAIYNFEDKKLRNKNSDYQKISGIVCVAISLFALFCLITHLVPFIKSFLLGAFGLFCYPFFITALAIGFALIGHKKYVMPKKYGIFLSLSILFVLCILQLLLVKNAGLNFWEYLGRSYAQKTTAGGFVLSLITAPVLYLLNRLGAYIVFIVLAIIFIALTIDYIYYLGKNENLKKAIKVTEPKEQPKRSTITVRELENSIKSSKSKEEKEKVKLTLDAKIESEKSEDTAKRKLGLLASSKQDEEDKSRYFSTELKKQELKESLKAGAVSQEKQLSSASKLNKIQANLMEIKNKSSYGSYPISNRKSLETKEDLTTSTFGSFVENKNVASMPKQVVHEQVSFMSVDNNNLMYKSTMEEDVQEVKNATPSAPQVSIIEDNEFSFNSEFFDAKPAFKTESNFEASSVNAINYQKENINANVINKKEEIISKNTLDVEDFSNSVLKSLNKENRNSGQITNAEKVNTENYKSPNVMFGESVEEVAQPILPKKTINYNKPPIELLTTKSMDTSEVCDDVVMKREELEMALDTFGIPAKVIGVVIGPAVTRYELEMPAGVSIKRLIALQDDIAYNLSSNGDIRIEAPIPGRRAVGIEVPNEKIATVALRDIILSREFMESKSSLAIALGKDISGMIKTFSLVKVPHLLIAGTSGSGKSVCINAIILSLIYKYSPDEVKLILVDPKRVEFSMYNHLPHLIMPNVITDSEKALNALNWCVDEMERRYIVFANARVKNLEEYNESEEVLEGKAEKMPYIIFIIDELADLLMTAKKEAEEQICRILQKARAAGIHMILATQRPSVDVVTGKIKTNLNARICFALMTSADSKTVLDQGGADKLLGKGDMLFMSSDTGIPKRIQGCFVTTKEIDDVVTYVKENNGDYEFDMKTEQSIINPPKNDVVTQIDGDRASNDGFDALMPQVLKSVIENGHASISMIQRKFLVGFPRAARIIDQMENAGYISPSDGSKSRSVYITMEEYDNLYGEG